MNDAPMEIVEALQQSDLLKKQLASKDFKKKAKEAEAWFDERVQRDKKKSKSDLQKTGDLDYFESNKAYLAIVRKFNKQ